MKRTLPLLLAIAAYFMAVLVWVGSDKRIAHETFDEFSTLNTGDKGLSLASRYLAKQGSRVSMLTRPVSSDRLARDGVMFRVVFDPRALEMLLEHAVKGDREIPDPPKTLGLTEDEYAWIGRGGRFILAIGERLGPLEIRGETKTRATKVFPIWRGIDALELPEPRTFAGSALRDTHTLFAIDGNPVISRAVIGEGELLFIAAPELLANKHVKNNLALLTALAGRERHIYFDEVPHGLRSDAGVIELLKDWRLGPFLLLLLVITATAFWRHNKSVGPPANDFRDTRSESVDLVASLGALFDRNISNSEAILRYHHELTRAVAAQTGLRGDALHKR
ncbi:MAG TPA: hypothetical protein VMU84_14070, partial [Thermoanaerobaculia bacterium]|nr:hypothetical protein [Thermoanaerobaculia bacterium]